MNTIQKVVFDGAHQQAEKCTCALYFGRIGKADKEWNGTGTLIEHSGRIFILTCKHVADDFFKARDAKVLFQPDKNMGVIGINRSELSLWRRDKRDDIALIEVKNLLKLSSCSPRNLDGFRIETNFSDQKRQKRFYLLSGYPGSRREVEGNRRLINNVLYGAYKCPRKPSTKRKLYLEYNKTEENSGPLPHPAGMSGAAVMEFKPLSENNKDCVWKFGEIVAIQHAVLERTRCLVCSPLRKLGDWLGSI